MFSVIQLSAQTNCMATCFCTDQRVSCIMIALKITFLQVGPVHLLSFYYWAIHPNLASCYFKMRGSQASLKDLMDVVVVRLSAVAQ